MASRTTRHFAVLNFLVELHRASNALSFPCDLVSGSVISCSIWMADVHIAVEVGDGPAETCVSLELRFAAISGLAVVVGCTPSLVVRSYLYSSASAQD